MAYKVRAVEWFAKEGMWYIWYDDSFRETARTRCFPDKDGRWVGHLDRTVSGYVALVAFEGQTLCDLISHTDKAYHLCAGDTFNLNIREHM